MKIEPKRTIVETWEVIDENTGEVKWVYDNLESAHWRVEFEQDKRAFEGVYPSNLTLSRNPTGAYFLDDERKLFAVKSVEFDKFEDFMNLVYDHPEDTFILRDVIASNNDKGQLTYKVRYATFSGDYYK